MHGSKMKSIIEAARSVLMQQEYVMSKLSRDKVLCNIYTHVSPLVGGSMGGHTRHSLQHYESCIKSIENDGKGLVDYDTRDRDSLLETDLNFALDTIFGISERLSALKPQDIPLKLRCNIDGHSNHNADMQSFAARELWFVAHHAVHHQAMIKVIFDSHPESASLKKLLPEHFGVAPSTISFRADEHHN